MRRCNGSGVESGIGIYTHATNSPRQNHRMTASWLTASEQLFESDLRREKVLTIARLTEILDKYGPRLGAPASLSGNRFVKTLVTAGTIKQVEIKPEVRQKKDGRPSYKPFN